MAASKGLKEVARALWAEEGRGARKEEEGGGGMRVGGWLRRGWGREGRGCSGVGELVQGGVISKSGGRRTGEGQGQGKRRVLW